MLMYGLWFKKPLDIRDATVVDSSGFTDDLALELLSLPVSLGLSSTPSETSGLRVQVLPSPPQRRGILKSFGGFRGSRRPLSYEEYGALVYYGEQSDDGQGSQNAPGFRIITPSTETVEVVCTLHPGQILQCGLGPKLQIRWHQEWKIQFWSLTKKDVLRWNRAARARSKPTYDPPFANAADAIAPPRRGDSALPGQRAISTRSNNFQEGLADGDSKKIDTELVSIVGLCSIMSGYGAIHLALWNFAFPSHAEAILWKVSGCTMMSPLMLCLVVVLAMTVLDVPEFVFGIAPIIVIIFKEGWRHSYEGIAGQVLLVAIASLLVLFVLLYVLARLFIVVESFLSLRMVPVGVYDGITWADYIPHL
jgi:hypothetical protein